ncbi:MAG TPA: secretin N-terminal domain-containing protein, partial [Candidatus Binataceae bacterium]|nr:secretin N-terminal domain-containing protein [Candidatus Binataceae bacterium]
MKRYFVAALVASFLLSPVGSSSFAAGSHSDPEGITMNFHQVDIPVLAKFISEITGKNFIIDESVRGKVDIISPTKVTPDEAYAMFQSALQIKGFTTQQVGKVIKIVPSREVRTSALLSQTSDRNGDEFVTRMVRLKNVDAESVVNVVQPMITHDGLISAFPQDNTLIITDNAANIDRMLDIIGSLDVQGVQSDVKVIPLKLAFATDLSPEVEAIMNARNGVVSAGAAPVATRPGMPVPAPSTSGTSSGFKVLPDERTNSLIVLAGPVQMREIEEIVAKLDIQPPNATSRIHVYHLKNAEASEVVMVLSNLINGGGGGTGTLSPSTGRNSLGRGSATGSINSGFGGGFAGAGGGGGFGGGMGGIGSSSGFGGGFG